MAAQIRGNVGQFDGLGNFFYNVCQRWVFSPARDGYTTIASIAGSNLVWTAEGRNPGANLDVDRDRCDEPPVPFPAGR